MHNNKRINTVIGLSSLVLVISLIAWGYQLVHGLIVTDMRNPFTWGLYIATFAFFVGVAAGGLIVSSSVYLFNIKVLKPFTRIASLSAFACTLGAGVMILTDMGRVDRVFNIFFHPNFRSPLVWDVIVITLYLLLTFLSVFVQLIPDGKKDGQGFYLGGWTGGRSLEEIKTFTAKWSKRISIVGLPVAILIHTVTALIFATQASRAWWNTAILPPDFIAVAVASGTALVMLISLIVVGRKRFAQYLEAFRNFARIIAGALIVHFFLVAMDLIVHGWWGNPEAKEIFGLVFGRYSPVYATELLLPAFVMVFFLTRKGSSSFDNLVVGSILLFIGVFAHRMMLMFPSFNMIPLTLVIPGFNEQWAYPVAVGEFKEGMPVFASTWNYIPTAIEYMIALLPFGLVTFVVSIGLKLFNFFPHPEGFGAGSKTRQQV